MSARSVSVWAVGLLCAAVGAFTFMGVASADTLPNGRFYEQVTPEEKLGSEVYQPEPVGGNAEYQKEYAYSIETETEYTFQAAADGNGIAYVAAPTVEGNENEGVRGGNEYLATRASGGAWRQSVLSPEGAPSAIFQAFSADLSTAFVNSIEPLSALAPGFGEEIVPAIGSYDVLYSLNTAGSEYVPFFSTKPPYRSVASFGTAYGSSNEPEKEANSHRGNHLGFLSFEGASADYSHLLFAANDALTKASENRPAAEGGTGAEFEQENNLYESVNGRLRLVNVLPDGTTHANATFGGKATIHRDNSTITCSTCAGQRVISADGSRVFWTDLSSGHIYVRENGATTSEISPSGTFQTATSDGSTAFYTNGDLYAYELSSERTTDLTPGVTVEKVLGASENGEYVYYVTTGDEVALWHDGVSTPIAAISFPQFMRAEVTPDGRSIVYMAREEAKAGIAEQNNVYVYDAEEQAVYCASCTSDETIVTTAFGSMLPWTNANNVNRARWTSSDGDRVFFISTNALVPQDTNGLTDVYEWERPGAGGCSESSGCVHLLSGGTSTDNSLFLDASENGDDAFIVTRANLVGSDEDGLYDVYDVRIGQPALAPPACTGTGCQGVPSPTPIFATPSSVTFEGVGNFAASAQAKPKAVKAKPKAHKRKQVKKKHKKRRKARKAGRSATSKSVRTARAGAKGGRS